MPLKDIVHINRSDSLYFNTYFKKMVYTLKES
jgi:hypothetical protein